MKHQPWLRTSAILLVLVIGLAACNSDSDPDTDGTGSEAASFSIQVGGEPEETKIYGQLAQNFMDNNPDVEIEVVEIADRDEHVARLATAFSSGEPPDVFLVNFRQYSQFVAQGGVEAAGPLMEERGLNLDDYYSQPVDAFTLEGELQCMPQNVASLVVYYNETVFENAGVDVPPDSWSWQEFRDTAEQLTSGEVHGVGMDPEIIRLAPFVWSNGGEIVDNEDSPTQFTLDTPEAREAIEFVVGLQRDGLMPSEQDLTAQDLETRFGTDKLGMLLESRKVVPGFREVQGLRWNVAPMPVADQPAGILHSDAYCIASTSDAVEAAADFVAYANGEEGQTLAAFSGRTVPALRSVAESGAFLDPAQPPANAQVYVDAISTIRITPVIPTWVEIEDVAKEVLTRLFYETDFTVDQAIEDLDSRTRPLFEEAGG